MLTVTLWSASPWTESKCRKIALGRGGALGQKKGSGSWVKLAVNGYGSV